MPAAPRQGHPRRPASQPSGPQIPRWAPVDTLRDARITNYPSPTPILPNISNSDLMRPGVHRPIQSSNLANKRTAPPTSGPAQRHRYSGWLHKHAAPSNQIIGILGLGPSHNPDFPLELEDLARSSRNRPGDNTGPSQDSRKRHKRLRKLERLAEQEDMKFSHSIQFNAVPDWSSNYISYSNLKKL